MELGKELASLMQADDCVVLNGDLGAGKTQFAKGFADGLGIDDDVTSPTFNILFEYVGDELPLLHFDLYRLDDDEELEGIDFFGLLESGAVSLVEWGDKFPTAMPDDRLDVRIAVVDESQREVSIEGVGPHGEKLEAAFEAKRAARS